MLKPLPSVPCRKCFIAYDSDGAPLIGGAVSIRLRGNRYVSFNNEDKAIANTDPVVLDSNGSADIYLEPGIYEVQVEDSFGQVVHRFSVSV